jgi:alkyl hydroperoxide reductase subunit D
MNLEELLGTVPAYARDIKLNFSSVKQQPDLSEQQTWGTIVAVAMACRNQELTQAVLAEAASHLSGPALDAAKSAAAIMAMNNIYYRFLHLSSNENYKSIPARLRMNAIRNHGTDAVDFELWCAAVSAVNGCAACVDSHERVLRQKGMSEASVLSAIRIAGVVHALATVFDAERAGVEQPVGG